MRYGLEAGGATGSSATPSVSNPGNNWTALIACSYPRTVASTFTKPSAQEGVTCELGFAPRRICTYTVHNRWFTVLRIAPFSASPDNVDYSHD